MPPGVMNVITGYGIEAGEAIVKHPKVPIITFTGSVKTGKRIAKISAKNLKKVSLELGGKDPLITLEKMKMLSKLVSSDSMTHVINNAGHFIPEWGMEFGDELFKQLKEEG